MYQKMIKKELERMGEEDTDPRHIEAFMRIEHGTLDHLSQVAFRQEIRIGLDCISEGGVEGAESLAQSFGL